ncbi:MAG TPA: sugar ABC transporter permease [Tepidimicrobium sp.]|nr:sugar ABC transporter permease [Tepidimicrobium sp.]
MKFAEKAPFIGLNNYKYMLRNPSFWNSLRITLMYTFFSVAGTFIVALVTALLVDARFTGRTVARVLITLPWAIPAVSTGLIWSWIFDYQFGVMNYFLVKLGFVLEPLQWFLDSNLAMVAVLIVTIWKTFPLSSLILLSGLQAIPRDLYEAAIVDGASKWQQFVNVTLPGLRPISGILLLLNIIWSLRRFTIIWIMTQGGPMDATQTLSVAVYRNAFNYFDMGYASALGVVGFLISLLLSIMYFVYDKRTD